MIDLMMFVLFIFIASIPVLLYWIYQRHVPVHGIPYVDVENVAVRNNTILLDLRDYSDAARQPVEGVHQLPYAYLNRHYAEIGQREVVVVVSDRMLLNLSARFLRKKGFNVTGYYIQGIKSSA